MSGRTQAPRPVECGVCGPRCANPATVGGDCDAFGPICLPVAYECPCHDCTTR